MAVKNNQSVTNNPGNKFILCLILLGVFLVAVATGAIPAGPRRDVENAERTRVLDQAVLRSTIDIGKEFLLRAEHPETHGFYKKYDAANDDFGTRVHSVYSASILFTLLTIHDFDGDDRIQKGMTRWADFLLFAQKKDGRNRGAIHYSYDFIKKEKEQKFVSGTASLSIVTLLDMYHRTRDERYLDAARSAGDWLLTMQGDNGIMRSYKRVNDDGKWVYGTKKSILYNGQALFAFSRLYGVTGENAYYTAAKKIANMFAAKVGWDGCYTGDDYRPKNPISSSWIIMSLRDFYQVDGGDEYKDIVFRCADDIVERQRRSAADSARYGTWPMAFSTSGNGWIAEVMMAVAAFCEEEGAGGCRRYRDAAARAAFWITQYVYSETNVSDLPNPENAIGGIFWNQDERYVRTDSLAHALNAFVFLAEHLPENFRLTQLETHTGTEYKVKQPFDLLLDQFPIPLE